MMTTNRHSMPQIKSMSPMALHAGIQFQPMATLSAGIFAKPFHQLRAQSLRPRLLIRDQVIHVTKPSPGETLQQTEAGDGLHLPFGSNESEPITFSKLLPHR